MIKAIVFDYGGVIKNIIESNSVSLSTIMKDGKPNTIGVAYVKVVSDMDIVITDN